MLFNEEVKDAAARLAVDDTFTQTQTQIGASIWTPKEKSLYFAALQRLGKDDLPGIARAVGTKSIPEVRHVSLLLEDAVTSQGGAKVTLLDIPAAAEVASECADRLELAADALASYQERFETKREQERYGEYWLITPEIAEEIEAAHGPSRRSSVASSLAPGSGDDDDDGKHTVWICS